MRVVPGALVDFFADGEIVAGVVVFEEKGRIRVVTESGREDRIAPGRVLAAYQGSSKFSPAVAQGADAGRMEVARQLAAAHARTAREKRAGLDVALVWELLVDEGGEKMLEDLAELAAGDRTAGSVAAMLRVLLEEKIHFARRGDLWEPRPRSAVEETLRQREREARRAEERSRFLAAAREAIAGRATFARSGEEEEARLLHLLEELAVRGTAGPGSRDALAVLGELPVSGETPEEAAFRVLRALGVFAEDENLFIRKFGLQVGFPEGADAIATRAVAEAPASEIERGVRRDLSDLEPFSVDDELTSEIDDALSVEPFGEGRWRVGIHIADPGFFFGPGSDLDRIAESRAVTFYLPERKVFMLPASIAEDAAALLPGVVRPALSFFATLSEDGEMLGWEIVPSVIRSRARVTYEEADDVVVAAGRSTNTVGPGREGGPRPPDRSDTPAGADGEAASGVFATSPQRDPPAVAAPQLLVLHRLAFGLEAARIRAGAHIIRAPEIDLTVLPDGTISLKRLEAEGPGRLLVSEMMVLAGRIAALFCLERSIPCIYRRQPPPEESFPPVMGGPYDPVAVRKARRGLRRGETGLVPGRHHALGLDAYAQATSPIRRYQDLAIHRQIKAFLLGGKPCYDAEALQRIAATTDEAERVARLAERGSDEYWTLRYLEREIGREVEGVVVYREPRRVEIELSETLYTVSIPPRPDHEPGQRLRFVVESVNPRGPSIRLRQIES